jgi:XTP/dITP diphosphohydrolase
LKELLLATRNRDKLLEMKRLLKGLDIRVLSLEDIKGSPDVEEDKDTLRANAVKKSTEISSMTDILVISDDSGLEVRALNKAPGVRSARYAGPSQSDDKNITKLLKAMTGLRPVDRSACFRCFVCLSRFGKSVRVVSGTVKGRIAERRLGVNGFGYDPVFIPVGFNKTFAQMSPGEKDRISHRGIALGKARSAILEYFQRYPL